MTWWWVIIIVAILTAAGLGLLFFIIRCAKLSTYEDRMYHRELVFRKQIQNLYNEKGYAIALDLLISHYPKDAEVKDKEEIMRKLDEILNINKGENDN